ncbi:hypothetical protein PAN31108_04178 [Pandoraea anhela]|uniref:Uncharacterized protein n=1 Tax=Pandoraea anhela TaxID=2508295 RepID=A0A5E4XYK5_9BURK|nr:hypothetical protein PAN31108_04178 [Pandoraea anhela]
MTSAMRRWRNSDKHMRVLMYGLEAMTYPNRQHEKRSQGDYQD